MRTITALLLSSVSLIAAAPALAQQTEPPATTQAPTGQQPDIRAEDVIVTAQKREQTLIEVPQSITVVSGADLENQQATNLQDYLKLVPGLQLNQGTLGSGRLVLRGINTGGVASTVATYVDETPFGSSTGLANGAILAGDFDTFDLARVEVLRGPQGTLYGANSLGGVVKYVTNAPDLSKPEGRARGVVETTRGGDLSYRGNAMINLPLGDTLGLRATGFYNKNGGWIDSIGTTGVATFLGTPITADRAKNINDSESYGGRASLLFKPSDAFDIRLTAFLQNIRPDASSTVEVDPITLKPKYGRQTQSVFIPEFRDVDYRVYNGLLNYDLGFATFTSSTSYATQKQTLRTDLTFFYSGFLQAAAAFPANELFQDQRTNTKRFTQEVRLAGADNDTFEWLLGGYYNDERGLIDQNIAGVTPGTSTPIVLTPPYPAGTTIGTVNLSSKYKEYAGFANATLHLGRVFDLDFGGRYSHNSQRAAQTAGGVLAAGAVVASNLRSSDDVFTYAVAPRFKINDRASIYLRVAKGYRPGGPNVIVPNAPANVPTSFDPDTTVNYEAGFKGETADRSFALDISGFHIDWDRIQLFTVIGGRFGVNINGGKARSDGVEFLATFRPTPGLVTSINGAYTKARLTADAPAAVGGLRGDRLPFTPTYSISTNVDYGWAIGGDARASFGVSLRFLSKQSANFDATYRTAFGRQRDLPSYTVLDLRAGVDFGGFSVEAFGRNITDAYGLTGFTAPVASGLPTAPNGAAGGSVIRPRTFGLAVTAGF